MNYKQHGNIAATLILVTFIIGGVSVLLYGTVMIFCIYCFTLIAGLALILFSFCRKCEQKNTICVHLNIGKLTRFMPEVSPAKYTALELAGTAVPFISMTLFPQYWLFKDMRLFIAYWVISAVAIAEISLFVCRGCENRLCMFCKCNEGGVS